MTSIFSKAFVAYAGERALKTFVQAFAGSLTGGAIASASGADWGVIALSAVASALISVATSMTAFTGASTVPALPAAPAAPEASYDVPDVAAAGKPVAE